VRRSAELAQYKPPAASRPTIATTEAVPRPKSILKKMTDSSKLRFEAEVLGWDLEENADPLPLVCESYQSTDEYRKVFCPLLCKLPLKLWPVPIYYAGEQGGIY